MNPLMFLVNQSVADTEAVSAGSLSEALNGQ